jgi:hypothetical protein
MFIIGYLLGIMTGLICYMVITKHENNRTIEARINNVEDINQNFDFVDIKKAYVPQKDVRRIARGKEQELFD